MGAGVMKNAAATVAVLLLAGLAPGCGGGADSPQAVRSTGGYLGQPPPGETPELFAPGTSVHHTLILIGGVPSFRLAQLVPRVFDPVLLEIE